MLKNHRNLLIIVAIVATTSRVQAQPILLGEQAKLGEHFRYELELSVEGRIKTEREGKTEAMALTAAATHKFVERVENIEQSGGIGKAVRYYETAVSTSKVGSEVNKRELPIDRRLTVAVRNADGTLHFSPAGPLTRDELGLIGEHFDTLCLPTLLPGKEVQVGGTWKLANDTTQHVCQFEGLVKNELVGTLTAVKDGLATFTITGAAEGVETGASARLTVQATGKFDIAAKRITELTWEQTDDRSQGAVTPASDVKAKITLKRAVVIEEPKELSAEARAKVPEDKVPATMTQLRYVDSDSKYSFTYSRDWHVVGRTSDHLILRLLEKNQFVAQATFSSWKKSEAGKHTSVDDFKAVVANVKTWQADGIFEEGEVPVAEGCWLYSVAMKGKQNEAAVVQTFYLLAGPTGDQVAVTVLAAADNAKKVAGKDTELIKTIQLTAKK